MVVARHSILRAGVVVEYNGNCNNYIITKGGKLVAREMVEGASPRRLRRQPVHSNDAVLLMNSSNLHPRS